MSAKSQLLSILPLFIMAASMPAHSVNGFTSLDQLCPGAGDCVIASDKTIISAGAPLRVNGNFTLNPGVVLVYEVPIQLEVMGNLVLSGTLGAPGNGGTGGDGGSGVGGAGGAAPPVASGVFDVKGSITLNGTVAAQGGSGGNGGSGLTGGGVGGAGAPGGSLKFNTCSAFTSTASILTQGGAGGNSGDGVAAGGAGGNGGNVTINARQTIVNNGTIAAAGGIGGQASGANGVPGTILTQENQSSNPDLAFCGPSGWAGNATTSIPTLSEWAMLFLSSLMAVFAVRRLRRR